MGINVIGKEKYTTITNWTPEDLKKDICQKLGIDLQSEKSDLPIAPLNRPPSICPGCPYKA